MPVAPLGRGFGGGEELPLIRYRDMQSGTTYRLDFQ